MKNLIDAFSQNDGSILRSPLESAFCSSCMSHLANISLQTGQPTSDDEIRTRLAGLDTTSECFERFSEQLSVRKVDTKKTPWHLGPELMFDGDTENFVAGDNFDKANNLLHRQDRVPYVVPEVV